MTDLAMMDTFEEKYRRAKEINIIYSAPYETKYAVVEYFARKGKPLQVVQYHIYMAKNLNLAKSLFAGIGCHLLTLLLWRKTLRQRKKHQQE